MFYHIKITWIENLTMELNLEFPQATPPKKICPIKEDLQS